MKEGTPTAGDVLAERESDGRESTMDAPKADETVKRAGPMSSVAAGRRMVLAYFWIVGIVQLGNWVAFFNSSRRSLSTGHIVSQLGVLLVVAFVSIRVARGASTLVTFGIAANVLLLLLLSFSVFYWSVGTAKNWGTHLSHGDALYVALGTLTTGSGDIQPQRGIARNLVTIQLAVDLVVYTILVGLVVDKVTARRRQNATKEGLESTLAVLQVERERLSDQRSYRQQLQESNRQMVEVLESSHI